MGGAGQVSVGGARVANNARMICLGGMRTEVLGVSVVLEAFVPQVDTFEST